MDTNQADTTNQLKEPIRHRWGSALDWGFVAVPSVLLMKQKSLGISDGELVALLNILASWWETEKLPFPGSSTLAKRMGTTTRTAQRHLNSLEAKGLITKIKDKERGVIRHDPSGLVHKLQELAALTPRKHGGLTPAIVGAELLH